MKRCDYCGTQYIMDQPGTLIEDVHSIYSCREYLKSALASAEREVSSLRTIVSRMRSRLCPHCSTYAQDASHVGGYCMACQEEYE